MKYGMVPLLIFRRKLINPMMINISKTLVFIVLLLISGCVHILDLGIAREGECEKERTICKSASNSTHDGARSLSVGDEPVEIKICACRLWNNSGIKVNAGEEYIFEVVTISECWQDKDTQSDPRIGWTEDSIFTKIYWKIYNENTRTDVANIYALVGRVGKKDKLDKDEKDESAFAILNYDPKSETHKCESKNSEGPKEPKKPYPYNFKNQYPITIMTGKDEELFFYANDRVGYYYNNKGMLILRMTKVKESN